MEIISELEEEFAARRLANGLGRLRLKTLAKIYLLDEAKLGPDFILGRSGNRIYFFPNHSIVEVSGLETQHSTQETLSGILSSQRQPVKLVVGSGVESHSAWLLNVEGPWMRVAGPEGVLWIPIFRLLLAETDFVVTESK